MATQAVKITREDIQIQSEDASIPDVPSNITFDLGNLACFVDEDIPIKRVKDSAYLASLAQEHTQYLVNQLFQLPTEPTQEVGRLIVLPPPTTLLPREKPVPEEKPLTKWQQFALKKGINKRKKDSKVWDEEHQEFKNRWGKNKANDKMDQWCFEHKEVPGKQHEFDGKDPWTKMLEEKKTRVTKNKKQQEANIRVASHLKDRKGGASVLDLSSVAGQSHPGKRNAQHKNKANVGPNHVDLALSIAQKSTNSMGKFDILRKGEKRVVHKRGKDNINALQKYSNEMAQSQTVMRKVMGRIKEPEALNMGHALQSVSASQIAKGDITTVSGINARKKLKSNMARAQKASKNSRRDARLTHRTAPKKDVKKARR